MQSLSATSNDALSTGPLGTAVSPFSHTQVLLMVTSQGCLTVQTTLISHRLTLHVTARLTFLN